MLFIITRLGRPKHHILICSIEVQGSIEKDEDTSSRARVFAHKHAREFIKTIKGHLIRSS